MQVRYGPLGGKLCACLLTYKKVKTLIVDGAVIPPEHIIGTWNYRSKEFEGGGQEYKAVKVHQNLTIIIRKDFN